MSSVSSTRFFLISALLFGLSATTAQAAVTEHDQAGRSGNWRKGGQGSPDLQACAKKAKEEPQNAVAQNDYGWALRQHEDLANAEIYLKKAESINPALSYIHSNLSVVFLDQNKVDEAIAEAKKAVSADDKQPIYRAVLGNALLAKGEAKAAIEEYNAAIKLRPDYENAYYNLGRAYQQDGQITEAKTALSVALKYDPNDERSLKLFDELTK